MITFEVHDMTCGHCVSSITKAVQAIDPGARVATDLATHRVQIDPIQAGQAQLSAALQAAGYTPVAVGGEAVPAQPAPPQAGCCGG
jgi:copper chaperone